MNTRARTAMVVLAVAVVGIGVTARAEPTLRYNYDYVCNRERVVVGHCRHDSDTPGFPPTTPEDDYCQVYYPDRPKTGGIEAMGTELRSDVMRMLQECGAFGATKATAGDKAKTGSTSAAAGPTPARPRAADTQAGSGAQTQKRFCDQIRQLRSLAPQGFKSIARGPMKDVPGSSAVSINLPSADACFVTPNAAQSADYSCSWTLGAATAERQFLGLGNLLAHCLDVRPDWSLMEVGEWLLDIKSAGASYTLVGLKEHGFMTLKIQGAER